MGRMNCQPGQKIISLPSGKNELPAKAENNELAKGEE